MKNLDAYQQVLDSLSTPEAVNAVTQNLAKANLVSREAAPGEQAKPRIALPEDDGLESTRGAQAPDQTDEIARQSLQAATVQLREIYEDRKGKVNRTYNLMLLFAGGFGLLLLVAAAMIFWQENDKKLSIATALVSLVPGYFAQHFNSLYKGERERLDKIEDDITRLDKMDKFVLWARNISDPTAYNDALKNILFQPQA